MVTSGFEVFGTGIRTKSLSAISILEESHVLELARGLSMGATTMRNAVDTLERAGLVVGIVEGNTRKVRLDPRFRGYDELKALLQKLATDDVALLSSIKDLRGRPRRRGKGL